MEIDETSTIPIVPHGVEEANELARADNTVVGEYFILEIDGASKDNPGPSGVGAVLMTAGEIEIDSTQAYIGDFEAMN